MKVKRIELIHGSVPRQKSLIFHVALHLCYTCVWWVSFRLPLNQNRPCTSQEVIFLFLALKNEFDLI